MMQAQTVSSPKTARGLLPEGAVLDPAPVLGVYVHWPFCVTKCPYCDFNSHVARIGTPADWAQAYCRAIAAWRALLPGARLASVFLGGGTPSLMPAALVEEILTALFAAFPPWGSDIEITLEANPTSVEAERFAGYRAAGVNRISLGIQALEDAALRFLGRPHTRAEALAALSVAQRHFERVNIDLITARPGQDIGAWERELEEAIGLGVDHISCYQLTIEPGTRFWAEARRGALVMPDADHAARIFALTRARLAAAGLRAYEVSNHARPGAECRHNLGYWRYRPYLGIGPGAHGRLPLAQGGAMLATAAIRSPAHWLKATREGAGMALAQCTALDAHEAAREALLMGLRLRAGVDPEALAARFGLAVADVLDEERCRLLVAEGLLARSAGRLRVAEAGWPVLDRLLVEILR